MHEHSIEGLLAYTRMRAYSGPFFDPAFRVAARFHTCACEYFHRTGLMMEKYSAIDTSKPRSTLQSPVQAVSTNHK